MSHSGNAELPLPRMRKHQTELEQGRKGRGGLTKMNPLPTRLPSSLRRVRVIMPKRQTNLNMEELRESYDQTSRFSIRKIIRTR